MVDPVSVALAALSALLVLGALTYIAVYIAVSWVRLTLLLDEADHLHPTGNERPGDVPPGRAHLRAVAPTDPPGPTLRPGGSSSTSRTTTEAPGWSEPSASKSHRRSLR